MVTSAANERVFSMVRRVVNSRKENLKSSSANDMFFLNSALKVKKVLKVWNFYFTVFLKSFCGLWNEPLHKLPLAMKPATWDCGFQTQWQVQVSDGNSAGRKRARFLSFLRVRGGSGQKFNPRRTLVREQLPYSVLSFSVK